MRLEPGPRETVSEHAHQLLDSLEAAVYRLSGPGDHRDLLDAMATDLQTLDLSCAAVHEFGGLKEAVAATGSLLDAMRAGPFPLDERVGGLLLQAVSTYRLAVDNLGTRSRAAVALPKVLGDLSRVLRTMGGKLKAGRVAPRPAAPSRIERTDQDARDDEDYRNEFLHDDAGLFRQLAACADRLAADPAGAVRDQGLLSELFRLVHTIKGNAIAFGFTGIGSLAHAMETALQFLQGTQAGRTRDSGYRLAVAAACLQEVYLSTRRDPSSPDFSRLAAEVRAVEAIADAAERPAQDAPASPGDPVAPEVHVAQAVPATAGESERFFLSVRAEGRNLLIPCGSVAEVLLRPHVLAVPGGRPGWLGVIRSRGALVPLLDTRALVAVDQAHARAAEPPQWAVVLIGAPGPYADASTFSVLVDDVRDVTELAYDTPDVTVLDVPAMMRKLGV